MQGCHWIESLLFDNMPSGRICKLAVSVTCARIQDNKISVKNSPNGFMEEVLSEKRVSQHNDGGIVSQTGPVARIAFCSIWERTDTWLLLGEELTKRGIQVFHIMTPGGYVEKAVSMGIPRENILWVRKDEALASTINESDEKLLCEFEVRAGVTAKHFVAMDRFLRTESPEFVRKYVVYAFIKIKDFIEKNDIQVVSGEPSTMHDLLALLICKATGRHYAFAAGNRFPLDRFNFFNSESEDNIYLMGAKTLDDVEPEYLKMAQDICDKIRSGTKNRDVVRKANKPPNIGFTFIRKLLRGTLHRALVQSKTDAHMYTFKSMFIDHKYYQIPFNFRLTKLQWNKIFDKPVEGEKFVFYALNLQPEHSVDVEAPYFMDTVHVLTSIARSLPIGVALYVKEHPNALGVRSPKDLKVIKQIPGVRVIDPFVDSHALLQKAELTVSLTGTVSIEAAIYGKRTVIFSNTFIKGFSMCQVTMKPWEVGLILRTPPPKHDPEHDVRYIAWLLSNSFPGTLVDWITNPIGISPDNIQLLANGYESFLKRVLRNIEISEIKFEMYS